MDFALNDLMLWATNKILSYSLLHFMSQFNFAPVHVRHSLYHTTHIHHQLFIAVWELKTQLSNLHVCYNTHHSLSLSQFKPSRNSEKKFNNQEKSYSMCANGSVLTTIHLIKPERFPFNPYTLHIQKKMEWTTIICMKRLQFE